MICKKSSSFTSQIHIITHFPSISPILILFFPDYACLLSFTAFVVSRILRRAHRFVLIRGIEIYDCI
ncbi:unnamed protein product [Rhodiola kirilowii]